jgi:hypothetical protein
MKFFCNWRIQLFAVLLCSNTFSEMRAAAPDPNSTNGLIGSWTFDDTTSWYSDFGYAPISFTNLSYAQLNGINCLVMDSTNASRLQFNVVEADSHTNITVGQGTLMFWYAGNWVGTNEGGAGPGQSGRFLDIGTSGSGWWSFCYNASGNIIFCGQTNGGSPVTYLTSPVAWTTNNGGWSHLALTYTATNSALYLNGILVTNGNGVTALPDTNTLNQGFFIGSDTNGTIQARGMLADIITYDRPLSASDVYATYLLYALLVSPGDWVTIDWGEYTNSASPFNIVTGTGNLISGGTNGASCVLSTNIWFTNVVGKPLTNGTELKFLIAGGADGTLYDVFANSVPALGSDTNRPWSWMGQAYHCVTNTLTITNQPNVSAFLILGKAQDGDADGLSDAFEVLVSKTNPALADSDSDGIPEAWEILHGLNPQMPGLASQDPDQDALTNKQEYLYGTKPLISEGFNIWLSQPSGSGLP